MKIHWLRVLFGGFLIEVVLAVVLVGGFAVVGIQLENSIPTGLALVIGVACFLAGLLVVLWLGRGINNHVTMHGFLMGLVATVLYVGLIIGAGQTETALASYGATTFIVVNALRMLGATLGGMVCERRRLVHA